MRRGGGHARGERDDKYARPALQCCLACGRTLTDRALHDELEGLVLAAIRSEHPEWAEGDEACEPCVAHYRRLLKGRATREERLREQSRRRWPRLLMLIFRRLRGRSRELRMKPVCKGV